MARQGTSVSRVPYAALRSAGRASTCSFHSYSGTWDLLERSRPALAGITSQRWLVILLFILAYQAIASLLFLPFSYYGGFVLQHRFGLSRQDRAGWMSDWVKSTL